VWSAILEVNPLATPTRGIPYQAVVGPEYASPAGLLPLGLPQNEVSTRAGQLHTGTRSVSAHCGRLACQGLLDTQGIVRVALTNDEC